MYWLVYLNLNGYLMFTDNIIYHLSEKKYDLTVIFVTVNIIINIYYNVSILNWH